MPTNNKLARVGVHVARTLLGALFVFAGLNGFFNFAPPPKEGLPEFAEALQKTGYMFPLIAGTQLLTGLLLLANRYVALALVVMAPVVVNIVAFHLFLVREGLVMSIIVFAFFALLVYVHRSAYRPLLSAKLPQ